MSDRRSIDDLKQLGASRPAPEAVVRLYREAFAEFGSIALWSSRELPQPSLAAALAITESLRVEGNLAAREIAERIESRAVPLSNLQSQILRLLAAHRDPESYVAGSTWLARRGARISGDIDIFPDREERVAAAAEADMRTLQSENLKAEWRRREPLFYQAIVSTRDGSTGLEWAVDSDFRFFPTVRDADFGYVLHPVDLATNKVMAAAGRREPRDAVDLVTIHREILPLGAAVWAAAGKSLGFTPEGIINEIRRLAHYTADDFDRVASEPPINPAETMRQLRQALDEADAFVRKLPSAMAGLLFLEGGDVVEPHPERLNDYTTHGGARRGHWPSSPEIGSAMLETYGKK